MIMTMAFWKDKAFWRKLSEKVRNCINLEIGQVVLELLIKTTICTFDTVTPEPLSLLKFKWHVGVSQTIYLYDHVIFFSWKSDESMEYFVIAHKTC